MNPSKDREDQLLSELGRLAKAQWQEDEARGFPEPPAALAPLTELEQARIVKSLPPARSWSRSVYPVALVAAAAGVALVALPPFGSTDTLPAYQARLQGGAQEVRSAPAPTTGTPRFRAGDRLEVVLQPGSAHDIDVKAVVRLDGPHPAEWTGRTEIDETTKALRLVGRVSEKWSPGTWTLTVWVGPASASGPSDAASGWQRHPVRFEILATEKN